MKDGCIAFACMVSTMMIGTADEAPDVVREICLPNASVVGMLPGEVPGLIEQACSRNAVLPGAVEVLIEEGRCFAITGKCFSREARFKDFESFLAMRHGPPLAMGVINSARWKIVMANGGRLVAALHEQEGRVTVTYAMDTEDEPVSDFRDEKTE